MTRSILSVSAGLAVIAVILAALWIGFGPRTQVGPDKRTASIPLSQQQRSPVDARGQSIRAITPGSPSGSGMAAMPPASYPSAASPAVPSGQPRPSADPGSPARQPDDASATGLRTETAPGTPHEPSVPPGEGVDLNTASVEQLNGLGAGMIGRRIVEFRPYTSPDELLSRRVLKRTDYDTIKNAVTVR
ncbi:Helix-hairpin-helix motif-containing protein [Methylobacterium phyllostachyos]|uniref:Helix-hairpin-helix motif-containing protein n=1 Tax=Methylobacterium phyllostachyos TaxID=582672 RepID=A0A1H0J4W0_9HYPH|nr:helix-hairpin-helix domain-containing protein [Methylobacterium phyllostachyos]SDO38632.1 Helix-hairpin-helix motif-containing protein [Methylobacterium phyllostachyos]